MITTPHTRPFSQPMIHHLSDAGVDLSKLEFYSTFDDSGSTLLDLSGKQNDGSIDGAIWQGADRYGQALWFDAVNDTARLANENNFDIGATENYTCWFWANAHALNKIFYYKLLTSLTCSTTAGGVVQFRVNDTVGVDKTAEGPSAIVIGKWYHVTTIINRTTNESIVCINGVAGTPQDITGLAAISNASLFTLGHPTVGSGYMTDIFGVTKEALDSETIKNLYNAGL